MRDPDLRNRRAAHDPALCRDVNHGLRALHDEFDGVIRIEHFISECLGPNCRDHYQPTRGGAQ
jgi:hypothetical protein